MKVKLLNGMIIESKDGAWPPLHDVINVFDACEICPVRKGCGDNAEFSCQARGMFQGYCTDKIPVDESDPDAWGTSCDYWPELLNSGCIDIIDFDVDEFINMAYNGFCHGKKYEFLRFWGKEIGRPNAWSYSVEYLKDACNSLGLDFELTKGLKDEKL